MDKMVAIADLKHLYRIRLGQQALEAHQVLHNRRELYFDAQRDFEAKSVDFVEKQFGVQVLIDQLAHLVTEVTCLRNVAGRAQVALSEAYQNWSVVRAEMMSAERDVAHRQVTLELTQMRCETDTDRISWHSQRRLDAIKSLDEAHCIVTKVGERVVETDDLYREALSFAIQTNTELKVTSLAYYAVDDLLKAQLPADCIDDELKELLSEFMLACMAWGVDASV